MALAPQGDLETATLVRVTDGDTIVVDIDGQQHRVRYIGMDTPEPNHPDPAVRAMAEAATAANAALLDGRELYLERDTSETDQFDRLLRNVWVETDTGELVMVGHELIRQGFAQVSTYPPDVRWVDHLLAAQDDARRLAAGLWAPQPTPSPSPPPTPEPTPAPTPLVLVVDDPMRAGTSSDGRAAFRGERGYYTFTSVAFPESYATLTWDVRGGDNNCYVEWALDPEGSGARSDRIGVRAGDRETGRIRFRTPYSTGEMDLKSTCPRWLVSLVGDTPPPPTPAPTRVSGGGGNCHPSYEGECLDPDLSDYDCASGSGNGPGYVYGTVEVVGYDEYELDRDGDGLGCE
jgi:endonuclease YncB( thermonuclease family)